MGRQSTFNQKDADEIVSRLSKGEPLAAICRDDWLPANRTVYDWMDADADFAARIARAREEGFDAIAAECLTIADQPNKRIGQDPETGQPVAIESDPQRDRLRVDTRLKLLAKWDPKRYGERLDLNHSGAVDMRRLVLGDQE